MEEFEGFLAKAGMGFMFSQEYISSLTELNEDAQMDLKKKSIHKFLEIAHEGAIFYSNKVVELIRESPGVDLPLVIHCIKSIAAVIEGTLTEDQKSMLDMFDECYATQCIKIKPPEGDDEE